MIGQPDIREPTWGAFQRELTIKDLKAKVAGWQATLPVSVDGEKAEEKYHSDKAADSIPPTQTVLLLYQPRTRYSLTYKHPTPEIYEDAELLLKVHTIGLNPIDWKAPDFNFGIPSLPYVSGRDFTATVAATPPTNLRSRFRAGDVVLAVSTDYRDVRKSAFQQYAIATDFNVCRLPRNISRAEGAALGVAFVAAALALGVCFGVDFSAPSVAARGADFLGLARKTPEEALPKDIRHEVLHGIAEHERPRAGDWVAVWGGSSTTSLYVTQLAKLAGLRVILVGDVKKHGTRLVDRSADLLVDSHSQERAIEIIRGVTDGRLRFAVDTTSKDTAAGLVDALDVSGGARRRAHLVGLAGVPKTSKDGLVLHTVPIKLFHEVRAVGAATMDWLERLLTDGSLTPPEVSVAAGGLRGVNDALDRMRRGEISGKRLVVEL